MRCNRNLIVLTILFLLVTVSFGVFGETEIVDPSVSPAEAWIIRIGEISGGLFIKAEILNGHPWNLTNVEWSITVTQGYIFFGKVKTGVIEKIPSYCKATVKSFVFGFGGGTVITVDAEASNGACNEGSALAHIFGPFTYVFLRLS